MVNRDNIKAALTDMVDELTECEALELEDFIVNHCSNDSFLASISVSLSIKISPVLTGPLTFLLMLLPLSLPS